MVELNKVYLCKNRLLITIVIIISILLILCVLDLMFWWFYIWVWAGWSPQAMGLIVANFKKYKSVHCYIVACTQIFCINGFMYLARACMFMCLYHMHIFNEVITIITIAAAAILILFCFICVYLTGCIFMHICVLRF